MSIEQDYIDLNNKIEEFLFKRAKYAKVFSTLIDGDSLEIITNNKFKTFIKQFYSFISKSNALSIIKRYPFLFAVMQTYIISEVSCIDSRRSFYEKFNSECGVCKEDLTDIFKECQEDIWENIKRKCYNKHIKFFIPERITGPYRYIQYPDSQVILSSNEMDNLLKHIIEPYNQQKNSFSLKDFKNIVNSNLSIKYKILEMVDNNKIKIFYQNQLSTIANQLYTYYLTKYFPYQIIKKKNQIINKKTNTIIHKYTMTILSNKIDIVEVSKNSNIKLKNLQKIFMSKTNNNIVYSLWYKAYDEENWTYTNVIYKKYCNYCFLCKNIPRYFEWIKRKLLVEPKVIGNYLLAFLDSKEIKILPEIDYRYRDKWFEYPIITGGKKIGRATYLEGFGPKINYTANSLLLINGIKVLSGDYLLDAKSGFYTIKLFIKNHYIKTSINIITSDKQQNILDNSYNDQYIYEIGYGEPPENIMENNPKIELTINNTSKDFLYTIIGKKTHKNSNLIKVMGLMNYGNK